MKTKIEAKRSINLKDKIRMNLANYGIIIVFIAMIILFGSLKSAFFNFENIMNILRQVATIGIISVGMSLIIITGGIDLSVGSTVGLSAVITASLMYNGVPMPIAIIVSIIMGFASGMFMGFFINELDIPPFVVSLSMMTILRGCAYIITQGLAIYGFSDTFKQLGQGYLGPIPIPVIIVIIIFVLGYIFLSHTKYGRYIYGVGGNEEAARLSGVNPKTVKYIVYAISGVLCSIAGLVLLGRVNSGNPNLGTGYELDAIAACILGGVSVMGGAGKIQGVVIGVLFLGVLTNGLILLNVNEFIQLVFKGIVLLTAVSIDKLALRQKQNIITVQED